MVCGSSEPWLLAHTFPWGCGLSGPRLFARILLRPSVIAAACLGAGAGALLQSLSLASPTAANAACRWLGMLLQSAAQTMLLVCQA